MKKFYFLLISFFYCGSLLEQKEGNVWVSGELAGINFNSGSAIPFKQPTYNDIWRTNASMCDAKGNLLFYTNGFRIFNKNCKLMQNGDSLNIGDYLAYGYDELPVPNGAVIIPIINQPNKHYIFHTDLKNYNDPILGEILESSNLYYDIVDMNLDNALGGVDSTSKEKLFYSDLITNSGMQAVKASNGIDWWLICHEFNTNYYVRFLIDSNGIHGPFKQSIGLPYESFNGFVAFGNFEINQEGTQLIKNNLDSSAFELYDFDRCTGELSNRRYVRVFDSLYSVMGLSFSKSGRYAYISANSFNYLYQFDLEAVDIQASKTLIGIYDGSLPTDFYDQALGPDGKIYICSYDYSSSLHVINSPDSPGLKCNFVQNQLQLDSGTYWGAGFPNLPNYTLGPSSGSGCDTVVTSVPAINQTAFTHGVYPNPCYQKFQLSITGVSSEVPVAVYNTMGELVFQTTLIPINGFIHGFFNLQNEPAGIYILKAATERGEVSEKIVKE